MKLGELCTAPCFGHAATFEIPEPGCSSANLKFGDDGGREFYAVLLRNHTPGRLSHIDPKLAILGLSPAATQIAAFRDAYEKTNSYGEASVAGAFAGLAGDIIGMLNGLGLSRMLGLQFLTPGSLAAHPEIYVTSLVACATLDRKGGSKDFHPHRSAAASRCVTHRLVGELTTSSFTRLKYVVVLGSKAWSAIEKLRMPSGETVHDRLQSLGKVLINLPHPSGGNRERIALAKLAANDVPGRDEYVERMWQEYRKQKDRKLSEARYRVDRASVWEAVQAIRDALPPGVSA